MLVIVLLILSIVIVVLASAKFNIHPFFSLLIAALFFGLCSGMPLTTLMQSINEGFGGTIGKIGIIIILGVVIGTFLQNSGGAYAIAERVLKFTGEKFLIPAMSFTGYLLSIPVFADSGFIMLIPLNKALTKKAGVSFAGTSLALAMGLMASHVMVPPTPGPIAAAGILGADLGSVILWGIIVSILTLGISLLFIQGYAAKIPFFANSTAEAPEAVPQHKTSAIKAFLPILIPIVLIILQSVASYPTLPFGDGKFAEIIRFAGNPVVALFIGLLIALTLPKKLDKSLLGMSGWVGEALKVSGPIVLITGAGGAFGKVLQNSDIIVLLGDLISQFKLGLLVPFFIAAALKTAQGSSTVALITTASVVAPLLAPLGLDSPFLKTMTVLAIGAGSTVISHINDSFFWVYTQMTGMDIKMGYRTQSLGTLFFGIVSILIILLISILF
ncbi:GntP family permease [Leptobacterium flavescens]|uniref:GntP family permease n=1 Tax=Leptobacterium flavescens TaxID=472055 RepID=A0A6P0UKH1_9FLAO|nr:GntP family permease [Leptobacterium flavescens]NER13724.1 GntP family permease [Leptobacterium flavescens]